MIISNSYTLPGVATGNTSHVQFKAKAGLNTGLLVTSARNAWFPLATGSWPATAWGQSEVTLQQSGPDSEGFYTIRMTFPSWEGVGCVLQPTDANGALDASAQVEIKDINFPTIGEAELPPPPPPPPPDPLATSPTTGKTLVWEDRFQTLDRTIWHAGGKPESGTSQGQYGKGYFAPYDFPDHDPYAITSQGLRIRAKAMPEPWVGPLGWDWPQSQEWVTGQLATARPDGTITKSFRKGYFEMCAKLPAGPGMWPAFWLLDERSILHAAVEGAVEIDAIEGYGHDVDSYVCTIHRWESAARGETYARSQKNVENLYVHDYTEGYHNYGVEVTQEEVIWYFDREEIYRTALYRSPTVTPFFILVTLAVSHDWPVEVPPEGYRDMIVQRVSVWQ